MRHAALLVIAVIGCGEDGGTEVPSTCALADDVADAGALPALYAQRCNVPGSMGSRKWYRIAATLPGDANHVVQVELYDNAGPFTGGAVRAGTFPVDADPTTCGVCVRAIGNKGTDKAVEYFGTAGSVTVTEVGADGGTFAASFTDVMLEQVSADKVIVTDGCTSLAEGAALSGTMMDRGGGGGGGGGGGQCATTVGDATP